MRYLKAFTLIELLIVVAIIAILAAIAIPNFLEAQVRAKVSRAKADLRTLATGLEAYAVDNNTYPYAEDIGASIWMPPGGPPRMNPSNDAVGGITSPIAYLTTVPDDAFKHEIDGIPTTAPLYYDRAGFAYVNGVKNTAKKTLVPADAVGVTSKLDGTGADTQVSDPSQTPAAWVCYSLGPDLNPFILDATKTPIIRSRYNLNNRYDPTNGTISQGNVVRYPGGLNYP